MTTLNEELLVAAHQLGRRDYQEGRPALAPVHLNHEEADAYRAGYLGEQKRARKKNDK